MSIRSAWVRAGLAALAVAFAPVLHSAQTDISTVPLETYSAATSTDVKPNIFFVLDDSGSMGWDFMPDWACGSWSTSNSSCQSLGQTMSSTAQEYYFRNSSFNGIYYSTGIRYAPPVVSTSTGGNDTTTYPSQTGLTTATGASSASKPNWSQVKDDAYGVQSNSTSNLTANPTFLYTTIPGEYCTTPSLRVCNTQTAATDTYPYPAYIRWCNSSALTTCKAGSDSTYAYVRVPTPSMSTFSITGTRNTQVSSITVGGTNILSATTSASTDPATVASRIIANINAAANTNGGYTAIQLYGSTTFTIVAGPASTTATPSISSSCPSSCGGITMTFGAYLTTPTAFTRQGNSAERSIPGFTVLTNIVSSRTSYNYPGTSAKHVKRTDCAGTSCTFNEEMTNYSNWWTYYRTRMQMMKTAGSTAFSDIDTTADVAAGASRFRVGYLSINNNTGTDFVNVNPFSGSNRYQWYQHLLAASPAGSTTTRIALSQAGRLYSGVLNGTALNGTAVTDPIQYSCQQNYTILSTDGFWNTGVGFKLDGSTAVGNQDAGLARPLYDGGSATIQQRTSQLQTRTVSTQYQTSTSQLQARSGQLQTRTSTFFGLTWSAWSNTSSCTWDQSGSTQRQCQYVWGNWSNVSTCNETSQNTSDGTTWSGTGTDCGYTSWSAYSAWGSAVCTPVAQSTGPSFTVATATQCNTQSLYGPWLSSGSCTAATGTECQYTAWSSWSNVPSCTAAAQSAAPTYTVGTATECQTQTSGGTSDTLADVAAYYYQNDLRDPTAGSGTGTCTGPVIPPNTVANNLCTNNVPAFGRDTATWQHMTTFTLGLGAQGQMVYQPDYWNLTSGDFYDVKAGSTASPSTGVCTWLSSGAQCNWPAPVSNGIATIDDLWHAAINGRGTYFSASDPNGLADGLSATLKAISNVPTPGAAAAAATSNPNISAGDNFVFSSSFKSVDWYGELVMNTINTNGTLSTQVWSAMQLLDCATRPWTAATSYSKDDIYNRGGNCYQATADYTSGATYGSTDTNATTQLTGAPITRKIYMKGSTGLVDYLWANMDSTQKANYSAAGVNYVAGPPSSGLTQFCSSGGTCLGSTARNNETVATGGAAGEALVLYLRGDRSNENTFYRARKHVLGDIVNSEARYVRKSLFSYTDTNYAAFAVSVASRTAVVYVAANDGMLHAFDATTGQEKWGFVPSLILPNMPKLADKTYSDNHLFLTDGTPNVSDICPNAPSSTCTSSQWKTILVAGLNRGGKGYYALDVTDPSTPKYLWEFSDASTMGYTYGNPVVTKLKDGTWVALLTSGYNNADGLGRVYVVNANTGALIRTIATTAGTAATPSGLASITGFVTSPLTDNTTLAVYGGDMLGNVWRFDVNGDVGAAGYDAQRLATLTDASGNPQSIEDEPTAISYNGNRIIYLGTGRYLGTTDVGDTSTQSFYAIKDNLGSTAYGNIRTPATGFVQQTMTTTTCPAAERGDFCVAGQAVRTDSNNAVDLSTNNGWYIDFPIAGERHVSNPVLQLGTIAFTTIVPLASSGNACGADTGNAASYLWALDYRTGGSVAGANGVVSVNIGSALATAPTVYEMGDGSVRALVRLSAQGTGTDMGSTPTPSALPIAPQTAQPTRRVSWRELPTQ